MKLLGEVLNLSIQYLKEKSVTSPRLVAETLLSHVLDAKRMDLYLRFECPLEEKELSIFRALLKKASLGEPVEYILSTSSFYGLNLDLSPQVLIPRPETEILVDQMAKLLELEGVEEKVLLDLCSGSGCIGLSLKKKFPALSVTLSDISLEALALSKKSAEKNSLDVTFLQGDLLAPFSSKKADYVVCNPPYISKLEYEGLDFSVKGYEPKLALVGGETGLEFYQRLALDLPSHLKPGAKVFLEIGMAQGEALNEIFSSSCWVKKELRQDWSGKDRFFFLEIE
jgi:release factor glutamine methyltransferase